MLAFRRPQHRQLHGSGSILVGCEPLLQVIRQSQRVERAHVRGGVADRGRAADEPGLLALASDLDLGDLVAGRASICGLHTGLLCTGSGLYGHDPSHLHARAQNADVRRLQGHQLLPASGLDAHRHRLRAEDCHAALHLEVAELVRQGRHLAGMGRVGHGDYAVAALKRRVRLGSRRALAIRLEAWLLARHQHRTPGWANADRRVERILIARRFDLDRPRLAVGAVFHNEYDLFAARRAHDDWADVVEHRPLQLVNACEDRAGVDAGLPRRRTRIDPADDRRLLLDAVRIGDHEADAREQQIHDDAGRDDDHPLRHRLVLEGARIFLGFLALGAFALADHLHVAAQGDPADLVGGLAVLPAHPRDRLAEADAERLDVDVAPLG